MLRTRNSFYLSFYVYRNNDERKKKKKKRITNERRKRIEDAKNLWRDITLASLGSRAISMVVGIRISNE